MIVLERGQTYDCANPKLVFYAQQNGWMTDVAELSFQVFDVSCDTKALNPVQVYPATPGDKQTVDVDNDCPTGGKLGTGRYAADWTIAADAAYGSHELHWFWRWEAGGTLHSAVTELEVLSSAGAIAGPFYCSVADMRAEGLTVTKANDARVLRSILGASRYIERVTGRFFEPRRLEMRMDGRGHENLTLYHPVIGVEEVRILTTYTPDPLSTITSEDSDVFKVYNRHIGGMLTPDDRDDPHIAIVYGEHSVYGIPTFYPGSLNVEVDGVFGYTDPDGGPFGSTPALIRQVCALLALRSAYPATSDDRDDTLKRARIKSEKTRDQSYTLDSLGGAVGKRRIGGGAWGDVFTGDPEIDRILGLYVRPPMLGAA